METTIETLLQEYDTNSLLKFSYLKAFKEFLNEDSKGFCFCEERLVNKLKAARLLFSKK